MFMTYSIEFQVISKDSASKVKKRGEQNKFRVFSLNTK